MDEGMLDISIIKPGDKLILRLNEHLGMKEMHQMSRQFEMAMKGKGKFILVPPILDVYLLKDGAKIELLDKAEKK